MARISPTFSKKISFSLFIILSICIIIFDITSSTFQEIRNSFKSFKISSAYVIKTISIEPISSIKQKLKSKNNLIKENKYLKDALDKSYIDNYLLSKESSFFKDHEMINQSFISSEYNFFYKIAQLKSLDPNMYKCCDKHRMYVEIIEESNNDIYQSVVFNNLGLVGQIINKKSPYEVLLLTDINHSIPIKTESDEFFCNARGSGRSNIIICSFNPLIWDEEMKLETIIFSSGLGGIYPRNIEIGAIKQIIKVDSNQTDIEIELFSSPMESDLFGVLKF